MQYNNSTPIYIEIYVMFLSSFLTRHSIPYCTLIRKLTTPQARTNLYTPQQFHEVLVTSNQYKYQNSIHQGLRQMSKSHPCFCEFESRDTSFIPRPQATCNNQRKNKTKTFAKIEFGRTLKITISFPLLVFF